MTAHSVRAWVNASRVPKSILLPSLCLTYEYYYSANLDSTQMQIHVIKTFLWSSHFTMERIQLPRLGIIP